MVEGFRREDDRGSIVINYHTCLKIVCKVSVAWGFCKVSYRRIKEKTLPFGV